MSKNCNDELKQLHEQYSILETEYENLLNKNKNFSNKFEKLLEQLPHLAVQGYNTRREVIYWNEFSTRLYGYTRHEVIGKQLEDLIIPDSMREKVIADIENLIRHDIPMPTCELSLRHKNGSAVPVFSQHILLELSDHTKEVFCVDIDLRELKEKDELLQEAKRLAITDSLTTLYNRLFYMQMAELELKLARRDRKTLVFAMYDMDNFKKFNDTYGHSRGDELLKAFAGILKQHCCRPNDYPFRIGGEEFLIIYTADSAERAPELARHVFDAFSQLAIPHKNNCPYEIATVSAGFAIVSPESKVDTEQVYHRADEALYKAKKNGRNNYIISYD